MCAFLQIGSRENFYSWAETSLVNALFFEEWYNGQWDDVGYAADQMAYVIGGARLRQVRVEDGELAGSSRSSLDCASTR